MEGKSYLYEYAEIGWDMICKYYRNVIPDLTKKQLHFVQKNQLSEKLLKLIVTQFAKIEGHLVEEDYKVNKKKKLRQENVDKQQKIIDKIKETKCFGCEQISYHLT